MGLKGKLKPTFVLSCTAGASDCGEFYNVQESWSRQRKWPACVPFAVLPIYIASLHSLQMAMGHSIGDIEERKEQSHHNLIGCHNIKVTKVT
jgi:hypothetical protein